MRKSTIDLRKDVHYAEQLLSAGTPMFVFDVETTGLKPDADRILSFSSIRVVSENGLNKIDGSLDVFINPGFPIPKVISEINGITDEVVKDCPREDEAVKEIQAFLGPNPFVAGYNSIRFDEKFVNAMYLRTTGTTFNPLFHLDVMQMGKEKMALPSYKLCNLAHELGADMGLTFHRSLDDVVATFRCFDLLRTEYQNDVSDEALVQVDVRDVKYWKGPRWNLRRIYVRANSPYDSNKLYYDIVRSEWVVDDEKIDIDNMREQVLSKCQVNTEKELEKALS